MVEALSIVNEVLLSKQWPTVTTIEGVPPLALTLQKTLQSVNYVGTVLGRFIFWRFMHTRGEIITKPEYRTGTVAVTNGSKTVVGTTTVWTSDMVGRALKTASFEEVYRIAEVTDGTHLVLSQEFLGVTGTTLSYTIAQDRYELPEDYDSELAFVHYQPRNIDLLSPERFDEMRFGPTSRSAGHGFGGTSHLITEDPRFGTIETTSTGRQVLVLDPFPKDRITIPFTYYRQLIPFERDRDAWPYPYSIRPVIHDGALHYLKRDAGNDPGAAQVDLQEFFNTRTELAGLTRRTDQFARFEPDTGIRRRMARRRITTVGVDLGSLFDRL